MVMLLSARFLIAAVPFRFWRATLGELGGSAGRDELGLKSDRLASDVEWAARRLPFTTKCLPKAVALSWMLRSEGIPHSIVLAARPAHLRTGIDSLHAWVDVGGRKVIGDLPGPWLETLRLGRTR